MNDILSNRRVVYKYISVEEQKEFNWVKEIIQGNKLWFSDIGKFNDPNELSTYSRLGDDILYKYFKNFEKNIFISKYKACCLSMHPDNLLLWSYYANALKGIVIGINLDKLRIDEKKYSPLCKPVMYTSVLPEELSSDVLFIKSTHWAHEQEFRIVIQLNSEGYVDVGSAIECIIFGKEIDPLFAASIQRICLDNSITMALAKPGERNFEIVISPLPRSTYWQEKLRLKEK